MTTEADVNGFLEHHGVKGMLKGFPKTKLDRISRIARGTATLKGNLQKARNAQLKKVEADAKKVATNQRATIVVDKGPTKLLPKVRKSTSTDNKGTGESFTQGLLKKLGTTRVVDLGT